MNEEWREIYNAIVNPLALVSKEKIINAKVKHPLCMGIANPPSMSITIPYAFKCSYCALLDFVKQEFYEIIVDTLGGIPFLARRTTEEDLFNGPVDNIVRIDKLGFIPEFSSSINLVEGVYLCDHCFECYIEDELS